MRDTKYKVKLKLNIPEWGMYKKGDIETFYIQLLDNRMGLVRWPIDPHWDIVEWNQYIGKDDVDNESIYENDRVEGTLVNQKIYEQNGTKFTGTIEWDEEDCGFYILNDDEYYPHIKLWFTDNLKLMHYQHTSTRINIGS